jgi:hypothetical protein
MNDDMKQFVWLCLAALAGALTALSFKQFQPLTVRERVMLVFVGFVFAIFVGPLIVGWVLPNEQANSKIVGALYYLIAAGSNWLLPAVIERLAGNVRKDEK